MVFDNFRKLETNQRPVRPVLDPVAIERETSSRLYPTLGAYVSDRFWAWAYGTTIGRLLTPSCAEAAVPHRVQQAYTLTRFSEVRRVHNAVAGAQQLAAAKAFLGQFITLKQRQDHVVRHLCSSLGVNPLDDSDDEVVVLIFSIVMSLGDFSTCEPGLLRIRLFNAIKATDFPKGRVTDKHALFKAAMTYCSLPHSPHLNV